MNTGELIKSLHPDGTSSMEPVIYCDICGWGDQRFNNPDDKYHFCYRHKEAQIKKFMDGSLTGYFERKAQQELNI